MIMQGNNKDKTVIKNGKQNLHLYLTLQLLAPKLIR
jgi:hypothetical protein